jgi:hypothetical protein
MRPIRLSIGLLCAVTVCLAMTPHRARFLGGVSEYVSNEMLRVQSCMWRGAVAPRVSRIAARNYRSMRQANAPTCAFNRAPIFAARYFNFPDQRSKIPCCVA